MKRLKINQIKLHIDSDRNELKSKIAKKLKTHERNILDYEIVKKSIDARKKPEIYYVYSVEVTVQNVPNSITKNKDITLVSQKEQYIFSQFGEQKLCNRPVIVGFGPAGMFCAYMLAKNGYRPIVLERGKAVDERKQDIERFWKEGQLNPESNVQFGEGGAGTFSDGKLNTTVNDKQLRNKLVLETLVTFGAKEDILYDAKPHIGTDILCDVVKNMREYIISKGGDIRFSAKVTDITLENHKVKSVIVNDREEISCDVLVLALGHSARDTFARLHEIGIEMEPKPFAIGVRVEHHQKMINEVMYGQGHSEKLPASPYKLTAHTRDGRGVYSFCMCPGGYVVNASSEAGRTVVNGMSYSGRNGENANSAIVVTIKPEDYNAKSPLDGVEYQRMLEQNAYREGRGKIPVQTYKDFKENTTTEELGAVAPQIKGDYAMANIRNVLPDYISESIIECMPEFSKKIRGFDNDDTILSAVESRTSSPLRIVRNDSLEAPCFEGIYPCGEGAGYAGGITSAAIDGIKVFEAIATKFGNDF